MAKNSTKTLSQMRLDTLRTLNATFVIDQFSTLNELFSSPVPAANLVSPPSTGYPTLQYLGIGRGGAQNVIGAGTNNLINEYIHLATDANFFQMIPFLAVPVSADISPTLRANYRLRVLETYNGVQYFVYYLKVISVNSTLSEQLITVVNGIVTATNTYVPSSVSLSPTASVLSNTTVNVANGTQLVVQATLTITLSETDLQNIVNACILKYGNSQYATISECGLVGGFDTSVTTTLGGVSATYTEIQTAQIMSFLPINLPLQNSISGISLPFTLSSSAPLPPSS